MNIAEFNKRFPQGTFIGMDRQPDVVTYFHDNGAEVGVWRFDRGSTIGVGEILDEEAAVIARNYYGKSEGMAR